MNEGNKMDTECQLKLENLFFDKITFNRLGAINEKELNLNFQVEIATTDNSADEAKNVYKVRVSAQATKKDEYTLEIAINGIFQLSEKMTKQNDFLIRQNTVAILMPYLRAQISLITTQPGVTSVVLPPINVAAMMDEKS